MERTADRSFTETQDPWGGLKPTDKNLQQGVGAAMGGQHNLANMLQGFGRDQFSLAGPAYGKALGFYGDLMGSAQSQRQALAPAIRNITEAGHGARSAISSRFARSGARDMAFENELRQRQGAINTMLAGAPAMAADRLGELSNQGLARALGAGQVASGAYGSMGALGLGALDLERQRKENNRNRMSAIGRGIAQFFGLGGGPGGGEGGALQNITNMLGGGGGAAGAAGPQMSMGTGLGYGAPTPAAALGGGAAASGPSLSMGTGLGYNAATPTAATAAAGSTMPAWLAGGALPAAAVWGGPRLVEWAVNRWGVPGRPSPAGHPTAQYSRPETDENI